MTAPSGEALKAFLKDPSGWIKSGGAAVISVLLYLDARGAIDQVEDRVAAVEQDQAATNAQLLSELSAIKDRISELHMDVRELRRAED